MSCIYKLSNFGVHLAGVRSNTDPILFSYSFFQVVSMSERVKSVITNNTMSWHIFWQLSLYTPWMGHFSKEEGEKKNQPATLS